MAVLAILRKHLITLTQKKSTLELLSRTDWETTSKSIQSIGNSLLPNWGIHCHKSYVMSPDDGKMRAICSLLAIPNDCDYKLRTLQEKCKILVACYTDFKRCVPNSRLYEIETIGDIFGFYDMSSNIIMPYDALKNNELPGNLHMQSHYIRFNPSKSTCFDGHTAFPRSSTLVTGLKSRKSYEGHNAKNSWV